MTHMPFFLSEPHRHKPPDAGLFAARAHRIG